jgi:single-stranded DNA-binding protein
MNNCQFVGDIYKKPQLKKSQGGTSYTRLFLKVDKPKGDAYVLVPLVVFGEEAEREIPYCDVGQKVVAYCMFDTGSFERDGEKVYTHTFKARHFYRVQMSESSLNIDDSDFPF